MGNLSLSKMVCIVFVFCAATAIASPAQTLTTLVSFDYTNGANASTVVQGTDGNFYGTTYYGGANGGGTVFKMTAEGTLTTLYSFCSETSCTDGYVPAAALLQATDGNFYGTTFYGGTGDGADCNSPEGCGTVFKMTPEGKLTTLHSFVGADGWGPAAPLIQADNGEFYGTTYSGGPNGLCPGTVGCGTVFEITPAGKLTMLYNFCSQTNCADGYTTFAALVQATNGNFYGTTLYGGADGFGTVFKITAGGALTTLYSFDGAIGSPWAGLVQATNGHFYGTTHVASSGASTVFQMAPTGTLTVLGNPCCWVYSGVVQATDGNLYGTAPVGGSNVNCSDVYGSAGCGLLYRITLGGTLTTLYNFCALPNCADGASPFAGLMQATNGNLYGTTQTGGTSAACTDGCGTVFSLGVGLRPFVETRPTSGKVGSAVIILGNDLKGTTSVTFNGTAATFTVAPSGSEITTTVPTGATTGTVEVTTPRQTLKSNVAFRVTP